MLKPSPHSEGSPTPARSPRTGRCTSRDPAGLHAAATLGFEDMEQKIRRDIAVSLALLVRRVFRVTDDNVTARGGGHILSDLGALSHTVGMRCVHVQDRRALLRMTPLSPRLKGGTVSEGPILFGVPAVGCAGHGEAGRLE